MSGDAKGIDNLISAFTEEQVTQITGVSKSQLRYWDKTDFFGPTQFEKHKGQQFGRIYSFRDLVSLKVLNDLRNKHQVPLQLLRVVKESWDSDSDDVWIKQKLYAYNKRVAIDSPEGLHDAQTKQRVWEIPIASEYESIKSNVHSLFKRDKRTIGQIEKSRTVSSNKPVIAGTRIPVKSIKAFAEYGYSIDKILEEYPGLTKKDVKAAINF